MAEADQRGRARGRSRERSAERTRSMSRERSREVVDRARSKSRERLKREGLEHEVGGQSCSQEAMIFVQALIEELDENPDMDSLDLGGEDIGDLGVELLVPAVERNASLTMLDLGKNGIGVRGVEKLGKMLESNSSLTELDLKGNALGATSVELLALSLEKNSGLQMLRLKNNGAGDAGARRFASTLERNSTLLVLDLTNNSITSAGVECLAASLGGSVVSLEVLDLGGNVLGETGLQFLATSLEKAKTLKALGLANCDISAEGAQRLAAGLASNTSLESLDLTENSLGEASVRIAEALVSNETLATLKLDANNIDNAVLERLAPALEVCKALRVLSLARNCIDGDGAYQLAMMVSCHHCFLRELTLAANNLSDRGAQHLANSLVTLGEQSRVTLEYLDLFSNDIGDDGANQFSAALSGYTGLTHLNLWNNDIEEEVLDEVQRLVTKNRENRARCVSRCFSLESDGELDDGLLSL